MDPQGKDKRQDNSFLQAALQGTAATAVAPSGIAATSTSTAPPPVAILPTLDPTAKQQLQAQISTPLCASNLAALNAANIPLSIRMVNPATQKQQQQQPVIAAAAAPNTSVVTGNGVGQQQLQQQQPTTINAATWQLMQQALLGGGNLSIQPQQQQQQQGLLNQQSIQIAPAASIPLQHLQSLYTGATQQQQPSTATAAPAPQSRSHHPHHHHHHHHHQQRPTQVPQAIPLLQIPVPAPGVTTAAPVSGTDTASEATSLHQAQQLGFASATSASVGGGGGEKRKAENTASHLDVAPRKLRHVEPYVVSSSSNSANSNSLDPGPPPKPKTDSEMEKMTPAERRRYERNLREQQRSYRISQQIKELRDVLAESNIPFKPNKFSILVNVAEYIKQLQSRSIMLDAEHRKLATTINQANNMVANAQVPSSSCEDSSDKSSSSFSGQDSPQDQDLLLVRGINYTDVFEHCPFPIGVASLDGRVLGVNSALERLFGCGKSEMDQQSLFLFIRNHQDLFEAMADLLKRSSIANEAGEGTMNAAPLLYWCGRIVSHCSQNLEFTITLTSSSDANPKYFSFAACNSPAT